MLLYNKERKQGEIMNKIESMATHICNASKEPVTQIRFRVLMYLSDWFSALVDGEQLTDEEYTHIHYLKSPLIDKTMENSVFFKRELENTLLGTTRTSYIAIEKKAVNLTEREIEIIDLVIDKTKDLYFDQLLNYMYSTYPFKEPTRYVNLDLKTSARAYHQYYNS